MLGRLDLSSNTLSGVVPAAVWELSSNPAFTGDLTNNFFNNSVDPAVPNAGNWSLGLNCFNLSADHVYEAGQQGADACSVYYPDLNCSCVPPLVIGIENKCLCVQPRRYIATFSCPDYASLGNFSRNYEGTRTQLAEVVGKGVNGWDLEQLDAKKFTTSLKTGPASSRATGQVDLAFDLLPPAGALAFTSFLNNSITVVMGNVSNFRDVQVPFFDKGLKALREVPLQFPAPEAPPPPLTEPSPPSPGPATGVIIAIVVSATVAVVIIAVILVIVARSCRPQKPSSKITIEGSPVNQWLLSDLKAATNDFDESCCLGTGGFANVYKAVFDNGNVMAVKRAKKGKVQLDEFENEITTVGQIHHRNLVTLTGYCIEDDEYLLVYEYMSNGSLQDRLFGAASHTSPLDWSQRVAILLGAASGLNYLHTGCKERVIHRDIKPANILLDDKLRAHIADFGLVKPNQEEDTHVTTRVVGTFGYLDPDYATANRLTEKSDVYSFGILMLVVMSNKRASEVIQTESDCFNITMQAQLALSGNRLLDFLAPHLRTTENADHAKPLVAIALRCSTQSSQQRPVMDEVVKIISGVQAGLSSQNNDLPLVVDEASRGLSDVHVGFSPMQSTDQLTNHLLQSENSNSAGASFYSSSVWEGR